MRCQPMSSGYIVTGTIQEIFDTGSNEFPSLMQADDRRYLQSLRAPAR